MTERFAIYLAPPAGSPLEQFARSWLGRDHVTGEPVPQPAIDGIAPDCLQTITASPRHYGFHATMKAPFRLADGRRIEELHAAARAFAAARTAFEVALKPRALNGFLALVPTTPSAQLDRLAADCVREFEPFRAALTDHDIARRRRSPLTPRQDAQMLRWGYPYVFEDFAFHMTLTGRLAEPKQGRVLAILRKLTAEILVAPMPVEAIAIYRQAEPDSPFVLADRFTMSRR